ncbi:hypothetical protein DVH24_030184 [Malus domestica]|uniref:Uncharacterized protein n=1 Tax=Malus domestica TaxID=3750 RepID=A0A498I315_MALDO|nr:hypothetical protein DVH24_030184 [Malus domestica]
MVEYNGSLPTFALNPYSWIKLLFVDAPIGTGFSYSRSTQGSSDILFVDHMYSFLTKIQIVMIMHGSQMAHRQVLIPDELYKVVKTISSLAIFSNTSSKNSSTLVSIYRFGTRYHAFLNRQKRIVKDNTEESTKAINNVQKISRLSQWWGNT